MTSTNALVPVAQFYSSEILPVLNGDPNNVSVIQASALNFIINFRRSFSPQDFAVRSLPVTSTVFMNPHVICQTLIPNAVKFLVSPSEAVRSFAAMAVEKLLDVKDRVDTPGQKATYTLRFGRQVLQPVLKGTLEALLNACENLKGEGASF